MSISTKGNLLGTHRGSNRPVPRFHTKTREESTKERPSQDQATHRLAFRWRAGTQALVEPSYGKKPALQTGEVRRMSDEPRRSAVPMAARHRSSVGRISPPPA